MEFQYEQFIKSQQTVKTNVQTKNEATQKRSRQEKEDDIDGNLQTSKAHVLY